MLRLKFLWGSLSDFLHNPIISDGKSGERMVEIHLNLVSNLSDDSGDTVSLSGHHGKGSPNLYLIGEFAVAHKYIFVKGEQILIATLPESRRWRKSHRKFVALAKPSERFHKTGDNLMADSIDHHIRGIDGSLEEEFAVGVIVKFI